MCSKTSNTSLKMLKDSFVKGILLGMASAGILYGLLILINILISSLTGIDPYLQSWQIRMLAHIAPLLLMRYFYIRKKEEKTAGGILIFLVISIIGWLAVMKLITL